LRSAHNREAIRAWRASNQVGDDMETAGSNTSQLPSDCRFDAPAKRRNKGRVKPQLLTRDQLDGRTSAAKLFDRLVADIEADLGGRDQLSTIERVLIEGFAGAALTLHHLNTLLALGKEIDLSQHAQAVSAMVRVASRLGVSRRAKDISPSLDQYLADRHAVDADTA
jgi:hypothetical protein